MTRKVNLKNESQGDVQRKLSVNVEPNNKRVNFFNSNPLSDKGMSLSYINPIMKNWEKVIDLKKEEVDKATEELKQALILFVVGDSSRVAVVERFYSLQVNTVSKPKVYFNNDWYFLVQFTNIDNRNDVVYSCPRLPNN